MKKGAATRLRRRTRMIAYTYDTASSESRPASLTTCHRWSARSTCEDKEEFKLTVRPMLSPRVRHRIEVSFTERAKSSAEQMIPSWAGAMSDIQMSRGVADCYGGAAQTPYCINAIAGWRKGNAFFSRRRIYIAQTHICISPAHGNRPERNQTAPRCVSYQLSWAISI